MPQNDHSREDNNDNVGVSARDTDHRHRKGQSAEAFEPRCLKQTATFLVFFFTICLYIVQVPGGTEPFSHGKKKKSKVKRRSHGDTDPFSTGQSRFSDLAKVVNFDIVLPMLITV